MLDANNGYNLNLTKRVLAETADCGIFWMEEPFHEDPTLYRDLREWLQKEKLPTLIADGEGQASPTLLDWARDGIVDVIQYDIYSHGFTRWLATGRQLDTWGARSAAHHYGGHYGNYASGHLAAAIRTRVPYVDPLNHLQIELIRRRRAGDDQEAVREGIHVTINGISAGLRNTG